MPPNEMEELRQRVALLEQQLQQRTSRRRSVVVMLAGGLIALVGGTAAAANGACPNGMPFCFGADSPAIASEVNNNFAQLKEWLEVKTGAATGGTVGSGTINNAGVTTTALNANSMAGGTLRLQQGTTSNSTAAAGTVLFVSGNLADGTTNTGGIEFRHDNLSQGIGFGFNTIYATGNAVDQHLQLKPKGNGNVNVLGSLSVSSNLSVSGTLGGATMVMNGAGGANFVSASCPGGKRIIWATGWTNDSNTPCATSDRQNRCAIPTILTGCGGQVSCSYNGSGNGCGNPGNSCIAITCN